MEVPGEISEISEGEDGRENEKAKHVCSRWWRDSSNDEDIKTGKAQEGPVLFKERHYGSEIPCIGTTFTIALPSSDTGRFSPEKYGLIITEHSNII